MGTRKGKDPLPMRHHASGEGGRTKDAVKQRRMGGKRYDRDVSPHHFFLHHLFSTLVHIRSARRSVNGQPRKCSAKGKFITRVKYELLTSALKY